MVDPTYDCLVNPLGAVRLTFEKAAASSPPGGDPAVAFNGKDWGSLDFFNSYLFEQNGLFQMVRRGEQISSQMLLHFQPLLHVKDTFGSAGCFIAFLPRERTLGHWSLLPTKMLETCTMTGHLNMEKKRLRDPDCDSMDLNVSDHERDSASFSKKQKEDEYPCHSSHSSEELMVHDSVPVPKSDSHNFDATTFSCLVKAYDLPESHLKLNDVFEFIGIYTFDPELAVYKDTNEDSMYDLMEDDVLSHLPPSKVPIFTV